ncbi:GD25304 [Drosophila simulans]|uniref:GD25304 n=1 Tax=Drosophila simulans TaxID=7240 RepID=B4QEI4_DROSI|nr:GD25304 [Drosophila simulans]
MFEIESTKTLPPLPPKCPCHQPDHKDCGESNRELQAEYHLLDIADVTDSVMKVMRICGLRPWEVKRAAGVIKRSLQHYEEIVQRIDRVPRKRFAKESFLHGLAHEAQMSRMDAQMAYSIVKRAFKVGRILAYTISFCNYGYGIRRPFTLAPE